MHIMLIAVVADSLATCQTHMLMMWTLRSLRYAQRAETARTVTLRIGNLTSLRDGYGMTCAYGRSRPTRSVR